jgi:hypothetical protein
MAFESTGSIYINSSTTTRNVNEKLPAMAFRSDLWISINTKDPDGLHSSSLTCTYADGVTAFSVGFSGDYGSFVYARGGRIVELNNVRIKYGPNAGRAPESKSFDFKISAYWTRNEACMASLEVVDRSLISTVVETERLYLPNPGIEKTNPVFPGPVAQPLPTPTVNPTPTPTPISVAPVRNIFGCLNTLDGGEEILDSLPPDLKGEPCNQIDRTDILPLFFKKASKPGVLHNDIKATIRWRLALPDQIKSVECLYMYNRKTSSKVLSHNSKIAKAICAYFKTKDSKIKTSVKLDLDKDKKSVIDSLIVFTRN